MSSTPFQRELLVPACRWLGSHARGVGLFAGSVLAFLMACVIGWGGVQLRVQAVDQGHQQVLQRMQTLQRNVKQMLDRLSTEFVAECSPANLNQLRVLLLKNRDVRHIGVLDDEHRLSCSTVSGRLDPPHALSQSGIDGSVGRYLLNTPLRFFSEIAPSDVVVTVIERGRFVVMIDDAPTQEVFAQYADGVWAGNSQQRRRAYVGVRGGQTDAMAGLDTPHLTFDWHQWVWRVTNSVPGVSPISVQSVMVPGELLLRHPWVLAGYIALCLAMAWLTGTMIKRLCGYLGSMDFLIRHLCQPCNVVCHYQPIIELSTRRVVGCEVLARLKDGEGLIYPDQFIPALNRQGLGWQLDAAVSRNGLLALAQSLPLQRHFTVALNFFPQNLRRDLILPHLDGVLDEAGRRDLQVELEITEYELSNELVPDLTRLKADGFALSIDDFGTGYSNLGIVKRVSPNTLKIDKSFVFEMEDATIRSTLIPEIIAIAKAIGSEVIAEGIESESQARQLHALGARFGQGYHFAKPMNLSDFLAFVQQQVPVAA